MAFYGSPRTFLSQIDANMIMWVIFFFVMLGATNFIFSRMFKKQKKLGTFIAIIISILTTYWTYEKYSFGVESFFYNLGFSIETLSIILYAIFGLLFLIVLFKKGFALAVMLLGIILIAVPAMNLVYEKVFPYTMGGILFLFGFFLWLKKKGKLKVKRPRFRRRKRNPNLGPKNNKVRKKINPLKQNTKKRNHNLNLYISGKGILNKYPRNYTIEEGKTEKLKVKSGRFLYWKVNGMTEY